MTNNPVLTLFDRDFLLYAGSDILSKTLVAFMGIWMACMLFDLVTDKDTKPSRQHLLMRGMLAFCVPFAIILTTAQANTMPSSYRLYDSGAYEIGKSLPAGTYAVSATADGSSLTIEGEDGKTSQEWSRGTMSVTVYDGDTLTLDGCSARNRTAVLVYNANASTTSIANGSAFLLGGADLRPGTYELTALGGDSEYEIRDGYLEAGRPLSPESIKGIAYADVHYGDVLYVKDASVVLYSNVFALPKSTDETDGSLEDDDAPEGGDAEENPDDEGVPEEDKKAEGGDIAEGDEPEGMKPEDGKPEQTDATNEKKSDAVAEAVTRVGETPWTRGEYAPKHDEAEGKVDEQDANDEDVADGEEPSVGEPAEQGPSFHDMLRRLMV